MIQVLVVQPEDLEIILDKLIPQCELDCTCLACIEDYH